MPATLLDALRSDVAAARAEAGEATTAVGRIMRAVARVEGKVDDLITVTRKQGANIGLLADAVKRTNVVEQAMRRKLDSFSELDPQALENLTERELRWRRVKRTAWKWTKRCALGALVGATTLLGATGAAYALKACALPPPVPVEVSP